MSKYTEVPQTDDEYGLRSPDRSRQATWRMPIYLALCTSLLLNAVLLSRALVTHPAEEKPPQGRYGKIQVQEAESRSRTSADLVCSPHVSTGYRMEALLLAHEVGLWESFAKRPPLGSDQSRTWLCCSRSRYGSDKWLAGGDVPSE